MSELETMGEVDPLAARRALFHMVCAELDRLAAGFVNEGMQPADCAGAFAEASTQILVRMMGQSEAVRYLRLAAEMIERLEQRAH